MAIARWLAVLAVFAVSNIGWAEAQQQTYRARDGRVLFSLSGAALTSAYEGFCGSQTERRCDAIENYGVMVNVEAASSSLTFVHRSSGTPPPGLVLTFICRHAAQGFACAAGTVSSPASP